MSDDEGTKMAAKTLVTSVYLPVGSFCHSRWKCPLLPIVATASRLMSSRAPSGCTCASPSAIATSKTSSHSAASKSPTKPSGAGSTCLDPTSPVGFGPAGPSRMAAGHLDEMFVRIDGKQMYRRRPVEQPCGKFACAVATTRVEASRLQVAPFCATILVRACRHLQHVSCHCDIPPRGFIVRPSRGRTDEASTVHGRADHRCCEGA